MWVECLRWFLLISYMEIRYWFVRFLSKIIELLQQAPPSALGCFYSLEINGQVINLKYSVNILNNYVENHEGVHLLLQEQFHAVTVTMITSHLEDLVMLD